MSCSWGGGSWLCTLSVAVSLAVALVAGALLKVGLSEVAGLEAEAKLAVTFFDGLWRNEILGSNFTPYSSR